MKKKQLYKKTSTKLIDLSRQGTLIVGSPRMGTHYLQALCLSHATDLGCPVQEDGEIKHVPGGPRYVPPDTIGSFLQSNGQGQYRLVILNHSQHKIPLLDQPAVLDDWHVIRLRDTDPYRWFWSWFLFMHSVQGNNSMYPALTRLGIQHSKVHGRDSWFAGDSDQGHYYDYDSFQYKHSWDRMRGDYLDALREGTDCKDLRGHHGSSRKMYINMLAGMTDRLPLAPLLEYLPWELNNHIIGCLIPADQEIEFQDLPALANHAVAWEPNDYPELDIHKILHHAPLLESILDRWAGSWPGVFKEKK
jgi:hypothetical protein